MTRAPLPSNANLSTATLNDVTTGASPIASNACFTLEHKILSVTGNLGSVSEEVTLGIVMDGNKPKILLNRTSSEREGISWNHAVAKVAVTTK